MPSFAARIRGIALRRAAWTAAFVLLAAMLIAAAVPLRAEVAPPEPRGRFVFAGWAGPPLPVWYQLPRTVRPDTPVVIVMHGVGRDADRYRDEWAGLARKHGFIVIVPEYSGADFPGSASYNTGFFAEPDGTSRPRPLWSFAAIEPLFDEVRLRFGTGALRYTLYGHSAGAQFVHRYVMFMPGARIEQAIAANAGWYTMPDPALGFPYGTAGAPLDEGALTAALGQPLTVLLGTADTNPAAPNLRTTLEATSQGPHRFARGQSFYAAGREAAAQRGVAFGWRMETVPGVGHQNRRMAKAAARLIAARMGSGTAPPPR